MNDKKKRNSLLKRAYFTEGMKDVLCIFLLGQGPVEPSSTNKPLAMRVVEDALAYSKKPPVI